MQIGLISDIHGQLDALHRALDLLEHHRVDRVFCAGDLVDKGPDPNGVVQVLNQALIPTVRGNHDEAALLHGEDAGGQRLTATTLALLAGLPARREYQFGMLSLWLTHAAPGCTGARFDHQPLPKPIKRALRHDPPELLVFGHHHVPTCRQFKQTWLLNPGSVCRGRPRDSHTCAIVDLWRWRFTLFDLEHLRPADVFSLLP